MNTCWIELLFELFSVLQNQNEQGLFGTTASVLCLPRLHRLHRLCQRDSSSETTRDIRKP